MPGSEPTAAAAAHVVELEAPGGFKRLLGRKGPNRISISAREIVVEHQLHLQAPLRFAPGAIAVATIDPGPAHVARDARTGRFPILRRLGDRVIPRSEGIEGWLWTSRDGSAYTHLGDDDVAPNVAIVFLQPLGGEPVRAAFEHEFLAELAKRTPLGEPAVFGLLLRAQKVEKARVALERIGVLGILTDREIPPVQRRHLPGDKPADPDIGRIGADRAQTSVPPPGMG